MDISFITPLVEFIQAFSAESLAVLAFFVCMASILILFRLFGAAGLYLYNTVAVVVAGLQVLKTGAFWFLPEPVALGTIAFSSTYLVSDILTEHYGKAAARKGMWLSFSGHILMTVLMLLTLGHAAPAGDKVHEAMVTLFTPSPRILVAGLLAYAMSQILDISLFDGISRLTQRRWLWLRANVATLVSSLVDNALFSVFAWVILSPEPIGVHSLIFTYILGTFAGRALISALSTPVLYLSYGCLVKTQEAATKTLNPLLKRAA